MFRKEAKSYDYNLKPKFLSERMYNVYRDKTYFL